MVIYLGKTLDPNIPLGIRPFGKHNPLMFITYRVPSISFPQRDDVYTGGVTAVTTNQMVRTNGFSNMYIGHGIEATHTQTILHPIPRKLK